jgi:hypothetical protein
MYLLPETHHSLIEKQKLRVIVIPAICRGVPNGGGRGCLPPPLKMFCQLANCKFGEKT